MKTFDLEWIEELQQQAKKDIEYWPLEQQMRSISGQLEDLRQTLDPEERKVLDAYLDQQKKMEVALIRMAYMVGVGHGKNAHG